MESLNDRFDAISIDTPRNGFQGSWLREFDLGSVERDACLDSRDRGLTFRQPNKSRIGFPSSNSATGRPRESGSRISGSIPSA